MTPAAVTRVATERDLSNWIPVAAAALPALLFFAFVVIYGVNVPNWDDFNLIPLLDKFQHGQLTLADLWAQHNENRVFFPNLVWLAASALIHDDLKIMLLFDALLMIGSGALFYLVWRRAGGSAWLAVPASFLYFTLLQHEDSLGAFQLSWYLISLGFAVIAFVLDREDRVPSAMWIAVIAAVVASFSSLQGLFCWPAGAVFLLDRSDRKRLTGWLIAGLLTTIFYFIGFDFHQTGDVGFTSAIFHPVQDVVFSIVALGGLFTGNSPGNSAALELAGILGLAVLASAVVVAALALRAKPLEHVKRLPFALLVFGALFLIAIGLGRSSDQAFDGAVASRYTMFTAYVPIATMFLLYVLRRERDDAVLRYTIGAFGMLVAIAIVSGLCIGNSIGQYALAERERDVARFTQAATEPDDQLERLWCCPGLVRSYAALADRDQLMTFAYRKTDR
jgi:hypothetical protein